MGAPADLFGASNSEGSARMEEWLDVMCRGCVKDRGRHGSHMGGMSCVLPAGAYADPDQDIPDWSPDAVQPARFTQLPSAPWPVCLAYTPRKRRSDTGTTRPPAGAVPLFTLEDLP